MSLRRSLFLPFAAALLLFSCTTGSHLSNQNLAWMYTPVDGTMDPQYTLYSIGDNSTRLYFKLDARDLLYKNTTEGNDYSADLLLLYTIRTLNESKNIVDSGHVLLHDISTQTHNDKEIAGQVDIDAPDLGKYLVDVSIRDLNKKTFVEHELLLDKTPGSRSYYMASAPENAFPLFRTTVDSGETFCVHRSALPGQQLYVRCFFSRPSPAPLPYALTDPRTFDLHPDSVFRINAQQDSSITLRRKGIYFFQADSSSKAGFTVFCRASGYPAITHPEQLAQPLRYLTTGEEYKALMTAPDVKKAVDAFWLDKCGSEERAREVIRYFYKRVEAANRYFSTQAEGWKSDRGMIFIVFGAPQHVYRSANHETWIYGDGSSPLSLNFTFNRISSNPFSDNDYELSRNMNYRAPWTHALDEWRKGRVYSER